MDRRLAVRRWWRDAINRPVCCARKRIDSSVGGGVRDHGRYRASLTTALTACAPLAAALAGAGRTLLRRAGALLEAARRARRLPLADPAHRVVDFNDAVPDASALPGVPGRIVVSTGMLDARWVSLTGCSGFRCASW